jgi:hypothetical protein
MAVHWDEAVAPSDTVVPQEAHAVQFTSNEPRYVSFGQREQDVLLAPGAKEPAGQGAHAEAGVLAFVPPREEDEGASHALQKLPVRLRRNKLKSSWVDLNPEPDGQGVHAAAPAAEVVPAGHCRHRLFGNSPPHVGHGGTMKLYPAYVPAGHVAHDIMPPHVTTLPVGTEPAGHSIDAP